MGKLKDELFWMNRNRRGMDEVGYLLSADQLEKETGINPKDVGDEKVHSEYAANDTFTIERVITEEQLKDLLTWKNFVYYESHASVAMSEEYPEYVSESYRIPNCVYNMTGFTSTNTPKSDTINYVTINYADMLGLRPGDFVYRYSKKEEAACDISILLHNGNLTEQAYNEILKKYELLPSVTSYAMGYMEYTDGKEKVVFDTYEENEYGDYWVDICPDCKKKYAGLLKGRFDESGSGVACCSVVRCTNTNAGCYADFKAGEVTFSC